MQIIELNGVVRNGIIVPESDQSLPEGTRVHITVAAPPVDEPPADKSFGERFAQFKDAVPDLPTDLANQHEHYRLGTPKR